MLKETFIALSGKFTADQGLPEELWAEIKKQYSGRKRHYHTLQHLENLLGQLLQVKAQLQSWDSILFALFYHDMVYDVLKSDNEEKSALLAVKHMDRLAVPDTITERSKAHILATKSHVGSVDDDANFFTDADLSVLGQDWETYLEYYRNVRKEYAIYPDLIYIPGRKKVLQHFLDMERIFKTDFFYRQYEQQARENLRKELESL